MATTVEQRSVSVRIDGKEVENSLKSIQKATNALYNEVAKLTPAAANYQEKLEELQNARAVLDEHRQRIRGIEDAWFKNIPAIKEFAAAAIGALAIDRVVEFGKALVHNGVEMDTNLRKAASVLANELGKINNEAEKHAHTFGIARSQYVGATADMSAFFQSQFATREEGAKLGNEAVKLAGVLAGFKGGGAENFKEALEAIKGGFSDNVEELAKFNIALSDDIIKSALAERGIDKLNAKQQEHAKGLVLLQLIQEKATAQITAFGDTAGSVARNMAELEAMLKEIADTLSKILVPILAVALAGIKPLIDALGSVADWAYKVANPLQSLTEEFGKQKDKVKDLERSVNPLLTRYDELASKTKLTKKEQGELKDVTQKIGEIMPIAADGTDKYGKALMINTNIAREYINMEKVRLEYINKSAIAETESAIRQYEKQVLFEKMVLDSKQKLITIGHGDNIREINRAMTNEELGQQMQSVANLQKLIDGANSQLKYLKGDVLKLPEAAKPNLGGMSEQQVKDAENRAKQIQSQLEKLRDAVKSHNSDLLAQNMRDDERDAERIKEKYRHDIELAEKLEKEKGKIGSEAHSLRLQLETARDAEIEAKKKENAEKIIDDLKKLSSRYALTEGDVAIDELAKKLNAIKAKFADEFSKVKQAEQSSDPAVKAQAKQTRLDLERAENAELEAERTRHVLEMAKKAQESFEQTTLANADDREREVWSVIFHYQKLIDENMSNHEMVKQLTESQAREIGEIRAKYREEDLKKEKDTNKKKLEVLKMAQDADEAKQKARFDTMHSFNNLLGAVLGESAKHSIAYFILTKGLAIAEILMNAKREASAIKTAYAAQALSASFMGPAGIALAPSLIATGNVLAGQAILRGVLSAATVAATGIAEWKANQKAEGGFTDVVGAQDGKTYRARIGGRATTGPVLDPTVFLAGEKPEYVIAYPEMQNPIVADFVGVVESIRQRRVRGYADGGLVQEGNEKPVRSVASVLPSVSGGLNGNNERFLSLMERFMTLIENGIYAKVTTEDAFELRKLMNKAVNQAGYEP